MADTTTQLLVLGAGPGGYAAAFLAADLGLQVTLVDPEPNPGGVCLYRGCIPSKALLHVAKVLTESREAADWGVTFAEPTLDYERMVAWKDEVIGKMTGGLGVLTRKRNITYVQGRGMFTGPNAVEITREDGTQEALTFDRAIVATGSTPTRIPGMPDAPKHILDSTSGLEVEPLQSLLVVGGGYIGLELGTVYASLGTRVTVVEMMDTLLPGVDPDLVRPLAKRLDGLLAHVYLNTKAADVTVMGNQVKVIFEGSDIDPREQFFDRVLVAVGRRPNTRGLGLEKTAVEVDAKGFITVDAQRRTAEPGIYAIGDVAGEPMLAHKATHEGRTAVEAIVGHPAAFEPAAIPAVVFTDPEIAWCGLTEAQAKAAGRTVEVARFPWAASGRSTTLGRGDGVTKLVIDPETERVLGVGICGPGAGELIAEGVLAVEMATTVKDLELTIHPHPTLSETMMGAAEVFFGTPTDLYRPRRK